VNSSEFNRNTLKVNDCYRNELLAHGAGESGEVVKENFSILCAARSFLITANSEEKKGTANQS